MVRTRNTAQKTPDLLTAAALVLSPLALSTALGVLAPRGPACPPAPSQPPGWVFGVAWTVLYLLVGAALAVLHARGATLQLTAVAALVLALNAWWLLFSPRCAPGVALAAILALFAATVVTAAYVRRAAPVAAALMAPLAAWLAFASYLSAEIALRRA